MTTKYDLRFADDYDGEYLCAFVENDMKCETEARSDYYFRSEGFRINPSEVIHQIFASIFG